MRIVHILWLAITLLIAPTAYAADANQDDFLNQMMNLPALAPEDITPPTENLQPDTTQQQTTPPSSAPVSTPTPQPPAAPVVPTPPSIPPSMPTVPDMPALPTMPAPPSSAPLSTPTPPPAPAPMPVPVMPPSITAVPDMPTPPAMPTMPVPPAPPSNPDAAPSEPVQSQSLPTPTPIPPVLTPDIPQTMPVVPNNPELLVSPTPPMAPISTPEPVTPPIPDAIPTTPDMSEPLAIPSLPPETPSIPTAPEVTPPVPEAIPTPTPPMAPISTPDTAPAIPPAPDVSTGTAVTTPEQTTTPPEENVSDGAAIAMPDELPKDGNVIKETKPFSWTGSVMFDINNSRLLRQALEALDRGYFVSNPNDPSGAPTLAEQAADAPPKPPMRYTSPSFFLNTLLYLSPENWAVWLNGKKYTHTLPDGDLTIMSVMENRVTIQLIAPAPIDILSPKWKTTLTARTEEGHYASDDGRIIVNPKNNSITFTLKPNQSFSVYAMRIVEGRVRDTSFTR